MTGPERLRPGLYPVEQAIRVEPLEPALPETALAEPAAPAAELLPPEPRRRSRAGRWFLGSVAAFLVAAVSVQAGFFVADMYQRSLLLGAAMSALLGLAGASGLWWILAELRQLRRLETVERVREEARRLSRSDAHGEAARFLAHVKPLFIDRPGAAERFRRLEDMVLETHADRDVVALFQREIIRPLDKEAFRAVTRSAQWIGVGVSVSPVAALDALLAVARSLRMIREIAEVYGFRPGLTSTLVLARHVIRNAALFSAADVAANLWVQHLGGSLAELVSSKLAEGVYAAVRVSGLGLLTVETCRPVPFDEDDRPGLDDLRRDILARLTRR
ncbi:MAG: TIGR01620 family protein [Dongiaceae bacterium]